MLNYIWLGLMVLAVIIGGCTDHLKEVADKSFENGRVRRDEDRAAAGGDHGAVAGCNAVGGTGGPGGAAGARICGP